MITGYGVYWRPDCHFREAFTQETRAAGALAAGDIRHDSARQVVSAVGEGAAAAIAIREYLNAH